MLEIIDKQERPFDPLTCRWTGRASFFEGLFFSDFSSTEVLSQLLRDTWKTGGEEKQGWMHLAVPPQGVEGD